jgi:hypothetical protein
MTTECVFVPYMVLKRESNFFPLNIISRVGSTMLNRPAWPETVSIFLVLEKSLYIPWAGSADS